jgi:arylsulfatase A-like enzyme
LAQTGTRFLAHYSASPLGDPARRVLLTGRTPAQLKASDATLEKLLGGIGYVCGHTTGGAAALQFLDGQSAGKPFFLSANFAPFATLPSSAGEFAQARFNTFEQEEPAKNAARGKEMLGKALLENLRKVAAATTALDGEIGSLTEKLTQKKLIGETLIIFTSPCGSLFGRHGLWASGDGSDPVNFFEEVVGTPMIWSWSGRVPPLATRPEVVSAYDLVPTICDITPAELPAGSFCGRSYLPLVTGKPLPKKQPWRTTVFAQYQDAAMARSDRYKVVVRNDGKGPGEIYDDKVDPMERVNQYDNPQFLTVKTSHSADLAKWKRMFSA